MIVYMVWTNNFKQRYEFQLPDAIFFQEQSTEDWDITLVESAEKKCESTVVLEKHNKIPIRLPITLWPVCVII